MTETTLVLLGGIEYERFPCESCAGSGRRYDPTLAENINNRERGLIGCPACTGTGTRYKITARGIRQECERRG